MSFARHGVGQLGRQARHVDAPCGQVAGGAQLGLLGQLVGPLDSARRGHHIGQHLALAHRLPTRAGPGSGLQPPGQHGLHLAACVGIHHHGARQFKGGRRRPVAVTRVRTPSWPLRGLGRKHAAIGWRLGLLPVGAAARRHGRGPARQGEAGEG